MRSSTIVWGVLILLLSCVTTSGELVYNNPRIPNLDAQRSTTVTTIVNVSAFVGNWSQYPAVSNVNGAGFNLTFDWVFANVNWSFIRNVPNFPLATDVYGAISGNRTQLISIINSVNSSTNIAVLESDPKWTANSTLVPYLARNNIFTGNNTFTRGVNFSASAPFCNGLGTCYTFSEIVNTGPTETIECGIGKLTSSTFLNGAGGSPFTTTTGYVADDTGVLLAGGASLISSSVITNGTVFVQIRVNNVTTESIPMIVPAAGNSTRVYFNFGGVNTYQPGDYISCYMEFNGVSATLNNIMAWVRIRND